jgi:hypothetical protein
MAVNSFDPAELRKAGVTIVPLPDERGRLIDGRTLPSGFADELKRSGLDVSKPLRMTGVIERRPNGSPGFYSIRFEQA